MRYLTPNASHERLGLYCLGAGYQEGVARPSRGRVLDCHAAVFVTAGRGQVRLGDQEVRDVVAPALFWLVPGVPHSYGPDSRGWAEHWVLFGGSATTGYEELGYIPRARPVAQVVDVVPLQQAFLGVAAACHRDGPRTDPVAKELLATSDLGVSSVARQVGYEDPTYFARIFGRKVGLSPTEFRSQQSLTG
nr:AraC family ligand binding domain-containing protein [Actinopolymorpha pittospori]